MALYKCCNCNYHLSFITIIIIIIIITIYCITESSFNYRICVTTNQLSTTTSRYSHHWGKMLRQSGQWRRYTRSRQVKWPGWKIHRPGSALPSPVYFFASGIVWTKNKNVTISDRLLLQWNGVAGLCFEGNNYKNGRQLFEEKVHPGDLAGGFFWPRNDLALLLRWRRYWFWLLSKMLRLID